MAKTSAYMILGIPKCCSLYAAAVTALSGMRKMQAVVDDP